MRKPKLKKVNLMKVHTREVDGRTSLPDVLFLHYHATIPTADSTSNSTSTKSYANTWKTVRKFVN